MEWDRWLMEAHRFYTDIATFCYNNQELVAVAVVLWVMYFSLLYARRKRIHWMKQLRRMFNLRRGNDMNRMQFKNIYKIRLANCITDAIEEAVFKGEIPQSYADKEYKKLAFFYRDTDYLPQQQRFTEDEYATLAKILFNKTRAPIPGAKPGEVDNVHVYAKEEKTIKKFGDKVRHRK